MLGLAERPGCLDVDSLVGADRHCLGVVPSQPTHPLGHVLLKSVSVCDVTDSRRFAFRPATSSSVGLVCGNDVLLELADRGLQRLDPLRDRFQLFDVGFEFFDLASPRPQLGRELNPSDRPETGLRIACPR